MRIRNIVLITAGVAVCVTSLNFLTDSFSILSKLPDTGLHHIEAARRDAAEHPFHERKHRFERQPRLESQGLTTFHIEQSAGIQQQEQELQEGRVQTYWPPAPASRSSPPPPPPQPPLPAAKPATVPPPPDSALAQQQQQQQQQPADTSKQRNKYHVVVSVNGNIYTQWQIRVCYYWYQKVKRENPQSAMGGFTRLLHSGQADGLVQEIPTVIVDPLPPGTDKGYVVLNRPYAFLQWVRKQVAQIVEDYVLMAEPDHIFLRPIPLWASPLRGAAFPFSYMEPGKNKDVIRPYVTNNFPIEQISPIGNSPVMLHKDNLSAIAEPWYDLSLRFKKDPAVEKAFGWILEMYAYTVASSQKAGGPLPYDLHPEMMLQPPWDWSLQLRGEDAYILHYTYGNDYDESGQMTYGKVGHWHFDKRDFSSRYPPKNISQLPQNINSPALRRLVDSINEASAACSNWAFV